MTNTSDNNQGMFKKEDPYVNSEQEILEKNRSSTYKEHSIFEGIYSLAYNDIKLNLPIMIAMIYVFGINLNTRISKNIMITYPFVSSPMDTVTDSKMAITMAIYGGIGIIHNNISIEKQVKHVKKVKSYDTKEFTSNSTVDSLNRLRVGAAISTHKNDEQRAVELLKAGADVLVIDSSQGWSLYQLDMIKHLTKLKDTFTFDIIAGNVVTAAQAEGLINAGADGLRVGMGSGSICTTQDVCAAGRAQASAVYHVARCASKYEIPIIADGGIKTIDHVILALLLGASTVMLGGYLSGCDETPGEFVEEGDKVYKVYRGMGSAEAMKARSGLRYMSKNSMIKVAQGVSGKVIRKGPVTELLNSLSSQLISKQEKLRSYSLLEVQNKIYKDPTIISREEKN